MEQSESVTPPGKRKATLDEKINELKEHKKKKRQLDTLFPDRWYMEGEPVLVREEKKVDDSDSDLSDNNNKKKQSKQKASKPRQRKSKSASIAQKRGNSLEDDPDYSMNNKKSTKKRFDKSNDSMLASPPGLKHKSLDDWIARYHFTKSETQNEVKEKIIMDITRSIDEEKPGNTEKREASGFVKGKRNRISDSVKKAEEDKQNDRKRFFDKDSMEVPFGMEPKWYEVMLELEKEEAQKDAVFRDEGRKCFDVNKDVNKEAMELELESLPKVTFEYNEQFNREPMREFGERPCCMDDRCIHKKVSTLFPDSAEDNTPEHAFTMMEWLNPEQKKMWDTHGILPEDRQLCYDDNVLLTVFRFQFYQVNGIEPVEILQDHQVSVDEPGGYSLDGCLPMVSGDNRFTGIARPFPKFSANRFVYDSRIIVDPNGKERTVKCVIHQNLNFQ